MQEEECHSDTGTFGEWGPWGPCSNNCGTGVQWRTKTCSADGKVIVPLGIKSINYKVGNVYFNESR